MSKLTADVSLLPDDEVLSVTPVPFVADGPRLGLDLVVDLFTATRTQMPVASRALDDSLHQGTLDAEFPRDALIMSRFVVSTVPEINEITVMRLCELQGVKDATENGHYADREEVGRIPHEIRDADDARAQEFSSRYDWQWPYFGAIDTTPLFISAVAQGARTNPNLLSRTVTQRDGEERTVAQCLIKAIEWLWIKLNASPLGLLETQAAANGCWQVWQDSPDAYHHVDASLARGSVAAIEVQAQVFDALMDMADLARLKLIPGDANFLWLRAQRLRRAIIDNAWVVSPEVGGYFAAGVERFGNSVRPLAIRTGNMGLLLDSRLLEGNAYSRYVNGIVHQLFDDNGLWSTAGIRTLAATEIRFRAGGYHTGSVWPWQNLAIARGLRRHGHADLAHQVETKMRRIADTTLCTPEFVQGTDDFHIVMNEALVELKSSDGHGEFFEHLAMQPAQKFQGWSAFALYGLELGESAERSINMLSF